MLLAVTYEINKYTLDPYNAPETFKKDVKAIKAKYKALQKFADEDLETYFLFIKDKNTEKIFTQFGEDYLEAQHYSEYIEGGAEAVFGVIFTILTAGVGGVAAAGAAGARLASTAGKLAPMVKSLAKLLKRKRGRKEHSGDTNSQLESENEVVTTKHKPYSKSRPPYKKGQVKEVWGNGKGRDGKVIDPTGKEITWDKSKPRNGQWDMGHKPNKEYRKLHDDYMNGDISKEKFLKEYQNPRNYRPELVKTNRGRKYEAK